MNNLVQSTLVMPIAITFIQFIIEFQPLENQHGYNPFQTVLNFKVHEEASTVKLEMQFHHCWQKR